MQEQNGIDKNSVIPIYYQLAKFLEGQIRRGDLKPGEALPTESEISTRFGISRMTVRRAISELVTSGMVFAQQGRGTFVASPKLDNIIFELNDFDKEIKRRGLNYKTSLLEAKIVKLNELLQKKFGIDDTKTKFLYTRTVLTAENEQLAYETKYALYSKSKPILESELMDPSLPGLVTAHSDYFPVSAKKVLQAAVANEEEASILGIVPHAPVFLIEQTLYDPDHKPVGWSKSIYRGDRYKLTGYDGWFRKE